MNCFIQDLRFAGTVIVNVVSGVLLAPLTFNDADRLVRFRHVPPAYRAAFVDPTTALHYE